MLILILLVQRRGTANTTMPLLLPLLLQPLRTGEAGGDCDIASSAAADDDTESFEAVLVLLMSRCSCADSLPLLDNLTTTS